MPLSYKDLRVITNGNDNCWFANMRTSGSTNFDLSFFEENMESLIGESIVTFNVGDQTVRSQVKLNRTEFTIRNNFVPFDIETFVENEKERVGREKEQAKHSDEPLDVFFVPSKTLLESNPTFPEFDLRSLVKNPKGEKYFVSHRWLSKSHPDPEGIHLEILKSHARRHRSAYYWIDYSCLPQPRTSRMPAEDEPYKQLITAMFHGSEGDFEQAILNLEEHNLFGMTLPRIAQIQSDCSTLIIKSGDYDERLWCYVEHYVGVLYSQTNTGFQRNGIEYLHEPPEDSYEMINRVLFLEEPPWNNLKVTNASDIPAVRYNYTWLCNPVKFQLYDRFAELHEQLPGYNIYSGKHYFQSAFGLDYTRTLRKIRQLFIKYGGDPMFLYERKSLIWLARRFSWSTELDLYQIDDLQFSRYLFFSEEMVGWIALLLGIIKFLSRDNAVSVDTREMFATIVLMSLFD